MSTYNRLPVRFVRGEGTRLWDENGKEYLDALSGIAVCGLGHAHPAVTAAICEQAATLVHTSNLYDIPLQETLAGRLGELANMDRAFFCNSGAEANEAAIKIARLYGHQRDIANPAIVVMEGSFHGRTLATLTATGNRRIQAGFGPLVKGFVRVPFNDLEAVENVASNTSDVVAVLVEPIQGEGGIRIPDAGYLDGLRALCDSNDWLLMLDEVQTGMGRTGQWFACQHTTVRPDVMTLAKGLGNGIPIGASLAHGRAAEVFAAGNHGSTFGGNPLVCNAALSVLRIIEEDNLCHQAATTGARMLDGFRNRLDGVEGVTSVRGLGLMLAIQLDRACGELVTLALEEGLLINVTAENVIRLLPPLVTTPEDADHIVGLLCALVTRFLGGEQ